jgi:hypothetical protein
MTVIKTLKGTAYTVAGLESGKLIVRQPSGKRRLLTAKDTGRARFDAAVLDYLRRNDG